MTEGPTFTCAKPGCDHHAGPDCPAWVDWKRCVLAAVSEGYCPLGHGHLAPVDPEPQLVYTDHQGRSATVTAEGNCFSCLRRWTIGESGGGPWFGYSILGYEWVRR